MLDFARRKFDAEREQAWLFFNQNPFAGPLSEYPDESQIFLPYFLFDWDDCSAAPRRGKQHKPGVVATAFINEYGERLTDLERMIFDIGIAAPVSFYEVINCTPGHGMLLKDTLIGSETEVEEHSASQILRRGDLCYGQICPQPGVNTMSRMAPIAIPPGYKTQVIALRQILQRKIARQGRELAAEDLTRNAHAIRATYLGIRNAMRTPPKLVNTDGEPYILHTLSFRIGSAQVAFDALARLAWGFPKQELLEAAKVDRDGTLRSVNFDWIKKGNAMHKTWDNTIMGHVKISGSSLVVEVNSASRAKKIREEIERRLGLAVTHLSTSTETPEQAIASSKHVNPGANGSVVVPSGSAPIDPEVQKLFKERLREQMLGWVHQKIPALGGSTPMRAVATNDGREAVESILLEWERSQEKAASPDEILVDIDEIRRRLKL
jgi:hypothetical protein